MQIYNGSVQITYPMERSPVMEEYIKRVYQLEQEHSRRVRTTEIAGAVDRTQASVTHMIQKLNGGGFVDYEEYRGVTVTEAGEEIALEVVRKHRLLETFLMERLGVAWPDVHEEADRLEHHISDEFTDRLADLLGNPRKDPHGEPIPNSDHTFSTEASEIGLIDCEVGDVRVVDQVPHHQAEIREYLFENNIDPGTTIEIDEILPVGLVSFTIQETGCSVSIPDRVARQVKVRPPSVMESA